MTDVTEFEFRTGRLTPGDAPTFLGAVAVPVQIAAVLSCGVLMLPAVACEFMGLEDTASPLEYRTGMLVKNNAAFLCHYWVTVTLSNGEACTLERTAAARDTAEACENQKSGAHLYWGRNWSRGKSRSVDYSVPHSVTLRELFNHCQRERNWQYDSWNNNCKHFCYNLMRTVFKECTDHTFAEFTGSFNSVSDRIPLRNR